MSEGDDDEETSGGGYHEQPAEGYDYGCCSKPGSRNVCCKDWLWVVMQCNGCGAERGRVPVERDLSSVGDPG